MTIPYIAPELMEALTNRPDSTEQDSQVIAKTSRAQKSSRIFMLGSRLFNKFAAIVSLILRC